MGRYFNWDFDVHQRDLLERRWSNEEKLLMFDEINKFTRKKNWVKGICDVQRDVHQFLITGSARLDVYKKGGDSGGISIGDCILFLCLKFLAG
jgi:predicted AAA+ superfamily ATPase